MARKREPEFSALVPVDGRLTPTNDPHASVQSAIAELIRWLGIEPLDPRYPMGRPEPPRMLQGR